MPFLSSIKTTLGSQQCIKLREEKVDGVEGVQGRGNLTFHGRLEQIALLEM
jgi:hypothetical protein